MGYFEGFLKKAVCVIPPHHELRKRTAKRNEETGKAVPEDAINAMKGEGGGAEGGGGGAEGEVVGGRRRVSC